MNTERTKLLPAFGSRAKPQENMPNHVFVMTGSGAWDRARKYNDLGYPALVFPYDESPDTYRWPVMDMDVTVFDFGVLEDSLEALAHTLLKAGAVLVVIVADAVGSGEIFAYRREALTNAA